MVSIPSVASWSTSAATDSAPEDPTIEKRGEANVAGLMELLRPYRRRGARVAVAVDEQPDFI